MTEVDFYFDVMCPWAYQTSKWIRDVRSRRDLAVTWKFFSLEEINRPEGKKHPWERSWSYGWSILRVAALLRRSSDGNDRVDRFYAAAGKALHEDGIKVHTPDGVAEALSSIGEEPDLVDYALSDETTHDDVKSDHDAAVALGGFGVPTLVLDDGTVLYGPVIAPAPTGAKADRLWDAVTAWSEFPHLYELRRPKTPDDWHHIAGEFAPYLTARDWATVQRPVS
jgi:2-hydroxychromene-2-carboxylate isomerase